MVMTDRQRDNERYSDRTNERAKELRRQDTDGKRWKKQEEEDSVETKDDTQKER